MNGSRQSAPAGGLSNGARQEIMLFFLKSSNMSWKMLECYFDKAVQRGSIENSEKAARPRLLRACFDTSCLDSWQGGKFADVRNRPGNDKITYGTWSCTAGRAGSSSPSLSCSRAEWRTLRGCRRARCQRCQSRGCGTWDDINRLS